MFFVQVMIFALVVLANAAMLLAGNVWVAQVVTVIDLALVFCEGFHFLLHGDQPKVRPMAVKRAHMLRAKTARRLEVFWLLVAVLLWVEVTFALRDNGQGAHSWASVVLAVMLSARLFLPRLMWWVDVVERGAYRMLDWWLARQALADAKRVALLRQARLDSFEIEHGILSRVRATQIERRDLWPLHDADKPLPSDLAAVGSRGGAHHE
ncbi:hypothetical protein [Silvimonas soli]|uniref:hypothetical protein n=1 Tax=Silvimonas soli TaxID=2980100 RepID=UPI0024B34B74|nr:hypothetical protein [Silvimonas soli]